MVASVGTRFPVRQSLISIVGVILCATEDYLKNGYYPFANEGGYEMRLRQVINQTMEVDIPQYANMNASTGRKLKKLLAVIAQSVPFKLVMESLAAVISVLLLRTIYVRLQK